MLWTLVSVIHVPLAEATRGYERFAAGGKLGKIVLVND